MAYSQKFTNGKYAWGLCDICGFRYRLLELKETTIRGRRTGLLACPTDWDEDHPQNFLDKYVVVDPQALRYSRPQVDLAGSRRMFPTNIWLGKFARRPDIEVQEKLITDQAIKDSNERIEDVWEQRRFRWANQEAQRGRKP